MNLSAKKVDEVRSRKGESAKDRPKHTDKALRETVKLGFEHGLPVVESAEGGVAAKLGDDVSELYEHYPTASELLFPEGGEFVRQLYDSEHITDDVQAANELGVKVDDVRKARELHDIDVSEGGGVDKSDSTVLTLPSGERWETTFLADEPHTDSRVLTQLLATDGMSVTEAANYLSEQGFEATEHEVRQAAFDCSLLADEPTPETSNAMRLGGNDKLDR